MVEGEHGATETILFVDDEPENVDLFRLQFEGELNVLTASGPDEALAILRSTPVAVLLTDERMPGMRGVELLAYAAEHWPDVVRVIVSAYGDAPRLLAAMNQGHAHEYVLKPWDKKEFGECIRRALAVSTRRRLLERSSAALAAQMAAEAALPYDRIIGKTGGLAATIALAARVATSNVAILIHGEQGTGKELLARFVHAESGRKGPFLRFSCTHAAEERISAELFGVDGRAIGRLETAARGTLFLDDVTALPLSVQTELAHALDEAATIDSKEVAPRLIASTQRDIDALVAEGKFSSSLRYHLSVSVRVPPLRDRIDDIGPLVTYFIEKYSQKALRLEDEALGALAAYSWPGNVRELESLVARAVTLSTGPTLTIDDFTMRLDLPAPTGEALNPREAWRASEAVELRRLLLAHGGNVSRAARALNVPRTTLLSRAKKFGLL